MNSEAQHRSPPLTMAAFQNILLPIARSLFPRGDIAVGFSGRAGGKEWCGFETQLEASSAPLKATSTCW